MGRFMVRGIRGATTVERNTTEDIIEATKQLLKTIVLENSINQEDIASVLFTVTKDLNAAFPAAATRELPGWTLVPLLCATEIDVPDQLEKCIRVLLHVNTEKSQREIKHVYLKDASKLRSDLA